MNSLNLKKNLFLNLIILLTILVCSGESYGVALSISNSKMDLESMIVEMSFEGVPEIQTNVVYYKAHAFVSNADVSDQDYLTSSDDDLVWAAIYGALSWADYQGGDINAHAFSSNDPLPSYAYSRWITSYSFEVGNLTSLKVDVPATIDLLLDTSDYNDVARASSVAWINLSIDTDGSGFTKTVSSDMIYQTVEMKNGDDYDYLLSDLLHLSYNTDQPYEGTIELLMYASATTRTRTLPEPSSMIILGSGILLLAGFRKRFRK